MRRNGESGTRIAERRNGVRGCPRGQISTPALESRRSSADPPATTNSHPASRNSRVTPPPLSLLQSKVSHNMPCQVLVNFAASRNGLFLTGFGVHVDVVVASGTQQHAVFSLESPKKVAPLHAIATSRIWYSSGTSSNAMSMKASRMFRSNSSSVLP